MNIIGTYNNTKSILSQTIEWINVLSTMYLIGSLILPFNLQKPAIYVYTISTIADIIVNKRYANVKWRNAKWSFAAMYRPLLSRQRRVCCVRDIRPVL